MAKKKHTETPKWLRDFFEAGLDRRQQLTDVLEISASGIAGLKGVPKLIEVLADDRGEVDKHHVARLEHAKRLERLAQSEEEMGFTTLHGFGVMALWSWLESFLIDLVVLWIAKRPSSLHGFEGPRIRMNVGDLINLKGTEKARYIVDL